MHSTCAGALLAAAAPKLPCLESAPLTCTDRAALSALIDSNADHYNTQQSTWAATFLSVVLARSAVEKEILSPVAAFCPLPAAPPFFSKGFLALPAAYTRDNNISP